MTALETTYFGLSRVREASPEVQNWAATDQNPQVISKLLHALASHVHSGVPTIRDSLDQEILYPGYDPSAPTLPDEPTLTETAEGILTPGSEIGVRLAYADSLGLETVASPEVTIELSEATLPPLTPILVGMQAPVTGTGVGGGTYVYAMTKSKIEGETDISDVLMVDVPYDANYGITLSFEALNTYTDGTTTLNIYRSTGLDDAWQLVAEIIDPAQVEFTDENIIAPTWVNVQPPTTNSFDTDKSVMINWSALTPHPTGADTLRVYVTQQTGVWTSDHLLAEFDLASSPPVELEYYGDEALEAGWPKNSTQIMNPPPKVDLGSQTTGAPILTTDMEFNGFQALNMRLHNAAAAPSTPENGAIYYDTATNNIRAYINGAWTNWGAVAGTTYTHPAEEVGGHIAANLKYTAGGTSLKTVLDRTNTSTGERKQVQTIVKANPTTNEPTTASTSPVSLPQMVVSMAPEFDNQWVEVFFQGQFRGDTDSMRIFVQLEYTGFNIDETTMSADIRGTNGTAPLSITWATQLGTVAQGALQFRINWWVGTGRAYSNALRRILFVKRLY